MTVEPAIDPDIPPDICAGCNRDINWTGLCSACEDGRRELIDERLRDAD